MYKYEPLNGKEALVLELLVVVLFLLFTSSDSSELNLVLFIGLGLSITSLAPPPTAFQLYSSN